MIPRTRIYSTLVLLFFSILLAATAHAGSPTVWATDVNTSPNKAWPIYNVNTTPTLGTAVTGTGFTPSASPAITPDGTTAWFPSGSSLFPIINLRTAPTLGSVFTTGAIGNANSVGLTPDGNTAWVTDLSNKKVWPITNLKTSPTLGTAVTGGFSSVNDIAITPDGTQAWVTDYSGNQVWPIKNLNTTPTLGTAVGGIGLMEGIAISPDGNTLWISSLYGNIYPIHNLKTTPTLGSGAGGTGEFCDVAITPDGNTAWVTDCQNNKVWPINSLKTTPTLGTAITGTFSIVSNISIAPNGNSAWFTSWDSHVWPINNLKTTPTLGTASSGFYESDGIAITPEPYTKSIPITISHTMVAGGADLNNFPYLFRGTYTYLANTANGGVVTSTSGYDIIFSTDPYGQYPIPFEQEYYSSTTGNTAYWIQIGTLSHTNDTTIYMLAGNDAVTTFQSTSTAVWNSNYSIVYHFSNASGGLGLNDSTAHANNGTNENGVTATPGQIASGANFNASSSQYIQLNSSLSTGSTLTESAWVKIGGGVLSTVFANQVAGGAAQLRTNTSNVQEFLVSGNVSIGTSNTPLTTGVWHYIVATYDGSTLHFYLDGSPDGTISSSHSFSFGVNDIGANYDAGEYMSGGMDEARYSTNVLSAGWIQTEYNNQMTASTFTTVGSYAYSQPITIDHAMVAGGANLNNFPLLVKGTFTYLANPGIGGSGGVVTSTSGYDIIFATDPAGQYPIPFEQEYYSSTTGSIDYWVKVPTLSYTNDTTIYMIYDNPAVTVFQSTPTAVWDTNYVGVWHLPNGTTLTANDSTLNANNGNPTATSATSGQIDGAAGFNGSSSYIDAGTGSSLNVTGNIITISAWINPTNYGGGSKGRIVDNASTSTQGYAFCVDNSNTTNGLTFSALNTPYYVPNIITTGVMQYVTVTQDGTHINFYVNGVLQSNTWAAQSVTSSSYNFYIGDRVGSGRQFDGIIDEVRVSKIARSAGWIQTEYNNQKSNSTFLTVGAYTNVQPITIKHSMVAGGANLYNFPLLIEGTYTWLSNTGYGGVVTNTNGYDIIFATDPAGDYPLPFEQEYYSSTTGNVAYWVQIGTLSYTADTTIYMLSGNSGVTSSQANPTAVWNSNYMGVWHMGETSGTTNADSTSNGNNATKISSSRPNPAVGQIDGAQSFNAANPDYDTASSASSLAITGDLTISAWINVNNYTYYNSIVSKNNVNEPAPYDFYMTATGGGTPGTMQLFRGNGSGNGLVISAGAVPSGAWEYIAVTMSGTSVTHYLNGSSNGTGTLSTTIADAGTSLYIGGRDDNATKMNGFMDEVRISNIARSAGWIQTEYNNQSSPGTYITAGTSCVVSTFTSVASSSWSLASTWDQNAVPASCDPVVIASNTVVTIDISTAAASTTTISGYLQASRVNSSSLTFTGGNVTVTPGGTFDLGTAASPIPSGITSTIILASGTYAGQYGLIVANGGNFLVYGSTKTPASNATSPSTINPGTSNITVTDATGWQVGDTVLIDSDPVKITSTPSGGSFNITAPAYTHTIGSPGPVRVADLTRNVLVRSSGTVVTSGGNSAYLQTLTQNATSFNLNYGEFAYLGSAASQNQWGLMIGDGSDPIRGSISSSTVHNGYYGIVNYRTYTPVSTFIGNNIYSNNQDGFNAFDAVVQLIGNNSIANGGNGLWAGANNSLISSNNAYFNTAAGIVLGTLETVIGNNAYSNGQQGFWAGTSCTLVSNAIYSNNSNGIYFYGGSSNLFASNNIFSNAAGGMGINAGAGNNTFVNSAIYSNAGGQGGVQMWGGAYGTVFAGSYIGYTSAGVPAADSTLEADAGAGTGPNIILKNTWVNPSPGIYTADLNTAGSAIVAYNLNGSTGTAQVYGDYQLSGSTLTLDYSANIYTSTATAPKQMMGSNAHTITNVVTSDTYALNEVITAQAINSNTWSITGSSEGVINSAFTCAANGHCSFTSNPVNFTLNPAATVTAGDSIDFMTLAASHDANQPKALYFGKSATSGSTWNNNTGRSKIEISTGAGFHAYGQSVSTPTVITLLGGSTYYTFVDSGAFNVQYASFTYMDESGVQLFGSVSPAGSWSINYSTFDYPGSGQTSTSTLITINAITQSTITLTGVTYSSSTRNTFTYNYNVLGSSTGLSWTNLGSLGTLAGAANTEDDPTQKHLIWTPLVPPGSPQITAVAVSSITVSWTAASPSSGYEVDASSTDFNGTGSILSTTTTNGSATTLVVDSMTSLSPNTTWYIRVGNLYGGTTVYNGTILSTSTLTSYITNAQIYSMGTNSITVNWATFGTGPGANTSEGYILQASSTNFNGTGTIYFSSNTTPTTSTLTVTGLTAGTGYALRVGGINYNGVPNYTALPPLTIMTAWVADQSASAVWPINNLQGAATLGTAVTGLSMPQSIAVTPDGNTAVAGSWSMSNVWPINNLKTTPTLGTLVWPSEHIDAIAITPDGNTAWTAAYGGNPAGAYAITNLKTTPTLGTSVTGMNQPWGITTAPNGNTAWVADAGGHTIWPVKNLTTTPTLGTGVTGISGPYGIVISTNSNTAWVADVSANAVWPINNLTTTPTLGTAITGFTTHPYSLALAPNGITAWVLDMSGNVWPINNLTTTPTVGTEITGVGGGALSGESRSRRMGIRYG